VRLLIVEDDVRMAALLKRALEEDGYAVDVSGDGQEALWLGRENDYDAIMLDAMLPGLDGFEIVRCWRAERRWAPVLMVTARAGVPARIEGLDAGADDYLAKPFSFDELTARIRALVRRGTVARPAILEAAVASEKKAVERAIRFGRSLRSITVFRSQFPT